MTSAGRVLVSALKLTELNHPSQNGFSRRAGTRSSTAACGQGFRTTVQVSSLFPCLIAWIDPTEAGCAAERASLRWLSELARGLDHRVCYPVVCWWRAPLLVAIRLAGDQASCGSAVDYRGCLRRSLRGLPTSHRRRSCSETRQEFRPHQCRKS